MQPALVRVLVVASTIAVVGPAFGLFGGDNFPLSNYPMFAADRGPKVVVYTALGVSSSGDLLVLSPSLIGGSPWPNLAHKTVARAAKAGPKSAARLCETIASRIDAQGEGASMVSLELVREHYDSRDYFDGKLEPTKRRVFFRCELSAEGESK